MFFMRMGVACELTGNGSGSGRGSFFSIVLRMLLLLGLLLGLDFFVSSLLFRLLMRVCILLSLIFSLPPFFGSFVFRFCVLLDFGRGIFLLCLLYLLLFLVIRFILLAKHAEDTSPLAARNRTALATLRLLSVLIGAGGFASKLSWLFVLPVRICRGLCRTRSRSCRRSRASTSDRRRTSWVFWN